MTTIEALDKSKADQPKESGLPAAEGAADAASKIRRDVTDDQICVLTFDRPKSQANLFDKATLLELMSHMNEISTSPNLKGLVLTSAKKSIFIAGADLNSLSAGASSEDIHYIIELGQAVFNRIAELPIPTVAAIHGACVGGGFEICLACDFRIASPERATKIGLPETKLGILPGWGGSARLPRLIGVPGALDIILGGKVVPAKVALKRGLVDGLGPKENLLDLALAKIRKSGASLKNRQLNWKQKLMSHGLVVKQIVRKVSKDVARRTRGHYPAIPSALKVVTEGVSVSLKDALRLERDAVTDLAQTEVCHNLIRIFFLQERAKKLRFGSAEVAAPPVARVAVIGAGIMGAGIAQWSSSKNISVVLRDINTEQVAKGMSAIQKLYSQGAKRHVFSKVEARAGLDRIHPAPQVVPLKNVDLVIEAAVEKMELKKKIFQQLDELAGPETILATNTSALSVSEIASATRHPERVVGIHFFNPVHRMQLVEVVVGDQTSEAVVQRAVAYVQQIGKLPVIVKDRPGFLVNRILMPYLIEAGHLYEQGASARDIDEAMLDFGMPMGPLRLIDEVGVDVAQHVAEFLSGKFSDRMHTPEMLQLMIDRGFLGRKSGRGFYVHPGGKGKTEPNPGVETFRRGRQAVELDREQLRTRMVLLMINEAARCLEEGVVAAPEDADFGMVMGTGFAPFLGGPLQFADLLGSAAVVSELEKLVDQGERQFAPCDLLKTMAKEGTSFFNKTDSRKGNPS